VSGGWRGIMSESRMPRITGHSNVRLEPEGREGEGASCLLRPLLQLAEGWARGRAGFKLSGPSGRRRLRKEGGRERGGAGGSTGRREGGPEGSEEKC